MPLEAEEITDEGLRKKLSHGRKNSVWLLYEILRLKRSNNIEYFQL